MPDAPTVPLAEVADRYTIERELGRGATAVVYLARDRSTARSVALKVLRPELAESLSAERFLREIRVTQTLSHPHIAPVLDSGVAGGLFYCVLDYMDGGTLRDRLDHERQLPMADIAAITRAVGSALDYAHRNRIIHRDVKPENILFGGGQACLADFGIARALETLSGPTTSTGVVRGTPAYMSPEQASGEREYDGRSDLYSLACVLYEATAGVPAFAGPNTQAVLAQRLIHVPRPLHVYRPTVTAELDAVMVRALATAPADRYQTAASFAEALCTAIDNAASPTAVTAERSAAEARARLVRRRRWMWGGGVGAAAIAAVVLGPLRGSMPWASRVVVDTTRIAVFPFQYPTSLSSAKLQLEQRIEAALITWSGVRLSDPGQIAAAIGSQSPAGLGEDRAAQLAEDMGAGRYLRGEISVVGDSLQVHSRLYRVGDTRDAMMDDVVKVPVALDGLDPAIRGMVARLLLRENASLAIEVGASHSLPAMQAWLHGRHALDMWQLDEADSALAKSANFDTSFARPTLWLAVVRNWTGAPPAQWSGFLERALSRTANLTASEASVGAALSAEQRADWDRACSDWRALTISGPTDFTMSFGLASCLRKDDAVIRDASSPSGWRFRASAQEMVQAYRRAFERIAIPRGSWHAGRLDRVPDLLFARSNLVRIGRTLPGGHLMVADPGWAADSLEFVPEPYDSYNRGAEGTRAATRREALRQQRRLFHEVAATWVAAVPKSPLALEALAVALKLLEDPAALDTLRLARSLATTSTDRVRLAAQEVWFRLTTAVPGDTVELRRIRDLADSLLRGVGSVSAPDDAAALVGLAALLGRVDLAARLAGGVGSAGEAPQVRSLSQDGPALLTYSAFGGPVARVLALEQSVTNSMNATALK
ncbi:MAG TPA: serine/threonine-protein kinase, partial [Gemmatimonadales bacterium]